MRLAFCLYKYLPHGGLARDMLRIAAEAVNRGHSVDIYAGAWQGQRPAGVQVTVLDAGGLTNHGRAERFARRLQARLRDQTYDAVVGFNKMPGLDFYYAADGCFAARARRRRPRAYALTPRYRAWRRLEASVFGPASSTRVLLLSEPARLEYLAFYATAEERLRTLPPTLDRAHQAEPLAPGRRAALRAALGVADGEILLLLVGSAFRTKGVDRAVRALAALPAEERGRARLVVAGRGKAAGYQRLAGRLGVSERVVFVGGRDDIPALLRAGDLLIHPARQENTGAVLLEALAAGLPVLTTGNCGYAHHVHDADAGTVLPAPFDQRALDRALHRLIAASDRDALAANARRYGQDEALYRMPETAVAHIESWGDVPEAPAFRGYVHPELAGLSRRLPRLEDWLNIEGEVFRRTADRRTLRFEHDGKGYFLKAHFGVGRAEILKNLLQLKAPVLDAGNEWLAIHLVRALGLPTLTAVALGLGHGWARRQSFLVTRELRGLVSLEDYAPPATAGPGHRRRLIRRVAATVRTLHGNGINHRDCYLCHFLFDPSQLERPGEIALTVIDLHRAQVRRRTPRRWRIKDLAGLYYSALGADLSRHERLRFVMAYTGADTLSEALADRPFWTRVERRALAQRRAELRRGYADVSGRPARSWTAISRPTRAVRLLHLASDADRCALLDDIGERPEAVMARGRVLKHDCTTTVVVVGDDHRRWVIKRYNTKNRWHALRRVFQTSRAVNSWRAAVWLRAAGIDTPRPVAVLEERYWGVLRGRSYFIAELAAGETLDQVLRREGGGSSIWVEQAADIVRRLRDHRLVHGDLKATNFVVAGDRILLVDLDAVRREPAGRNVNGLDKDLERFLRNWADDPALRRVFETRLR